jgi:hypothetical protein
MINIILPVLYHTDETEKFKELEMEYKLSQLEEENMHFYNIDGLTSYEEEGIEYTVLHLSGDLYYIKMPIEEVEELIDNALKNSLKQFAEFLKQIK